MSRRTRAVALLVAAAGALALPAAAWAHAVLVRTVPVGSRVVNGSPAEVSLTYSEAVEPRFAIVSVTDAAGTQRSAGPPHRSPTNARTLVVPIHELGEGWYLVYWRVISVDGHPVRGAFTFAVGPNPGPAPQFVIPSLAETAASAGLVAARAAAFVTLMAAIGLFLLRIAIARPLVRRVPGTHLRWLSIAFFATAAAALVAVPVYTDVATAQFALRSAFDLGAVVPLLGVSAFGHAFLDLELVLALFVAAAAVALWVDRPQRPRRSIAELFATAGALLAAAAVLVVPGLGGHAAQTSPRGAAVLFDWLHLSAASIWVGGLLGLLVLWRSLPAARRVAGLVVCVPRFSNVAFVSVLALIGSGIGASVLHLPTLATLWDTRYGKVLVLKIVLLGVAMLAAAVNLLRNKPRLAACDRRPELGPPAASLLRRLVGLESGIVVAAVVVAALLSSLAPPAKALARIGKADARVGPGAVTRVVERDGYRLEFRVDPNRAVAENDFAVTISRGGRPIRGADVTTTFAMLDMEMGEHAYRLPERAPGVYRRSSPALVMVGHWGLSFEIAPTDAPPFTVFLVDRANG